MSACLNAVREREPMQEFSQARVALLVETARAFGRELLQGVAQYSHDRGPWSFHISPGDYEQVVPKMKQWRGTGIIARIPDEKTARQVLAAGVPTVTIGMSYLGLDHEGIADIFPDENEVAKLAADHLLERGFRNFAYVGSPDRGWCKMRYAAFCRYLHGFGIEPYVYESPPGQRGRKWEFEQSVLADWIGSLPTPMGVFACDDDRGREVLEASALAGVSVPEDLAVVGVDNDDVFCELSDPPLSSVRLNARTAGYRAAQLLDSLMSGHNTKPSPIVVEALGVVGRRSSEIVAIDDEEVAEALKIIHNKHGKDVSVEMIVDKLAVSRRNLEKRFRETLGRSILDEVQRARLNYSKRLLVETPYPISRIARIAGFGSVGYFIQFFQRRVGKTPGKYREDLTT
jgi:LacI family transcriptional regulator